MEKQDTFFKDYQALVNSFDRFKKDTQAYNYKYATLPDILKVVKEKCTKHNFILVQSPHHRDGKNILETVLRHKDGQCIKGTIEIVAKDPTDPQKVGGGLTYMRRYSLTCMLGLEEEDDDAKNASEPKVIQQDRF